MAEALSDFTKFAPYLTHPLVLVGFVLLLTFGIHRALITSGVIPPVSQRTGGRLLGSILRYGFALAAIVIVLGFGLRYMELRSDAIRQEAEHRAALAEQAVLAMNQRLGELKQHLKVEQQRGEALQEQSAALAAAVKALTEKEGPEIDDALQQLAQGDTSAAKAVFQHVVEKTQASVEEQAAAYRHLGALAFLDDTEAALNNYRRATQLDPDNAEGWIQLGLLLVRYGKLNEAVSAYELALDLGTKTGARDIASRASTNLGNVYARRGELDQAVVMYGKAVEIDEAVGDKAGLATNYGNLGIVHEIRGELDQAFALYQKALEIDKALGRQEGMANDYGNLGNLHRVRGELDRAVAMYHQALMIDEALGRKENLAVTYGNLGNVYTRRGELDRATAMYQKALEIDEAIGRKEGMAIHYGNLGVVHWHSGELDRAAAMYQKALEINEALGRKEGMAMNYGALGNVHWSRGELDQAVVMYRKAIEIDEALGAKKGLAVNYSNLGLVHELRDELDQAVAMWRKAEALFREMGSPEAEKVRAWIAAAARSPSIQ